MAQVHGEWIENGNLVIHKDPDEQWNLIKQTLEVIKEENLQGRATAILIKEFDYEIHEEIKSIRPNVWKT